jgi:hypothetical protein
VLCERFGLRSSHIGFEAPEPKYAGSGTWAFAHRDTPRRSSGTDFDKREFFGH